MDEGSGGAQVMLVTPPEVDLAGFAGVLAACLDAAPVACLRLALAGRDEDRLSRAADALREVAHARDVAVVLDRHAALAQRLGLDGVHLPDGAKGVRAARALLGADAIVGASCGASRHDGMTAAEDGADYVAFDAGADPDLFAWWSEAIEVPVVAEGAIGAAEARALAPLADFLAFGAAVWGADDPPAALRALTAAMAAPG